jgi:hypothetical protein
MSVGGKCWFTKACIIVFLPLWLVNLVVSPAFAAIFFIIREFSLLTPAGAFYEPSFA